jgi:serine/threonine-protein kinase
MSPEQARDDLVDLRSDVFGLGGMLCELLTGQPPFKGQNLQQVCTRAAWARHDEAMLALEHCDGDVELVNLAKECLSADPDDRPNHAGEVAYEITAHLESATEYAHTDLERFFDLSMDMFCIAGLEGYFHRVNSNFTRVLGFTKREMLSRPVESFVHPDDTEKTNKAFEVLGAGMPIVRFQNRYLDINGKYHTFEWTAKSIPEENTVFAVARDVTGTIRDSN